jgi:hypothetical protein
MSLNTLRALLLKAQEQHTPEAHPDICRKHTTHPNEKIFDICSEINCSNCSFDTKDSIAQALSELDELEAIHKTMQLITKG